MRVCVVIMDCGRNMPYVDKFGKEEKQGEPMIAVEAVTVPEITPSNDQFQRELSELTHIRIPLDATPLIGGRSGTSFFPGAQSRIPSGNLPPEELRGSLDEIETAGVDPGNDFAVKVDRDLQPGSGGVTNTYRLTFFTGGSDGTLARVQSTSFSLNQEVDILIKGIGY